MKLEIDIIKSLLTIVEESLDYPAFIMSWSIHLPGLTDETVVYHLSLMLEAGLIRGKENIDRGTRYIVIERLTWDGHTLLANMKNETIWKRFKEIGKSIGIFSLDTAQTTLVEIAKQHALQIVLGTL